MCSVYYHYTSGWAILHILFLLTGNASWYSAASFLSFQSIWQEEDVTPVGQCSQCFVVSLGCGGGGGGDAQLWWWIDAFHYWLGSSHMSATYKSMAIIRKPRPSLSLMFSIAVIKYNIWHLFITCQYSNPMIWHSFHLILVMTVIDLAHFCSLTAYASGMGLPCQSSLLLCHLSSLHSSALSGLACYRKHVSIETVLVLLHSFASAQPRMYQPCHFLYNSNTPWYLKVCWDDGILVGCPFLTFTHLSLDYTNEFHD